MKNLEELLNFKKVVYLPFTTYHLLRLGRPDGLLPDGLLLLLGRPTRCLQ